MAADNRFLEFRKRLRQGFGVSEAAECAGLSEDEVEEAFAREAEERSRDDVVLASVAQSRVMSAVECLEELLQDESPLARLGAAKELLKLAVSVRPKKVDVRVSKGEGLGLTLWDFSAPSESSP
jgi:hypothetical protein